MDTMKSIKYLSPFVILLLAVGFFSWSNRVTHLDPPLLKTMAIDVGKQTVISGIAYPNARIAIYLNDSFVDEGSVSSSGSFQQSISFENEGTNKIKVKQLYKNITSEFSDEITFQVDTTPPNKNSLKIESRIPSFSAEKSIAIMGQASPSDKVLINDRTISSKSDGSFSDTIPLVEGSNVLAFYLRDEVGNTVPVETHTVYVDTTPPRIKTGYCSGLLTSTSPTEEYVCVSIGDWQGYLDSSNSIAITGSVEGDVKSITVDGKNIRWDENNEIYQRINLYIHGGINKYKVVVEDKAGNVSTAYVETSAERTQNSLNVNMNQ